MRTLDAFPIEARRRVKCVLTDIDGTLTTGGRLTGEAYRALERLGEAGFLVVPITGRPAGWCDHIARMWPVDAVVGENGAFYFRYDHVSRRMTKRFLIGEKERAANRRRLDSLAGEILRKVPGTALASDQLYREADLAIDYCEDVAPLAEADVARIVAIFEKAGASAKISSIHVNGWFGAYDKLAMTRTMAGECFGLDMDAEEGAFVFIGDSPNDGPMFAFFSNSVGVANVRLFEDRLEAKPAFVTGGGGGAGFAELAAALIAGRQ